MTITNLDPTNLDLAALELEAAAHELLRAGATPPAGECNWACERFGLTGACQAVRQTPTVNYDATELLGLEHHHICWMLTLLSDPTIAHYEPMPVPPKDPQAEEILGTFIDRLAPCRRSAQGWLVMEAGQRVGVCQLRRTGEGHLVGVSLQESARKRGLGTALFKALGDWGLRDGGFVAGEVEHDNVLSHGAIVSAGYIPRDHYTIVLADRRPARVTRYENS